MTDTSMERLMSLAALTASVATTAPSPVRGEPDYAAIIDRAERENHAICDGGRWRMCIPVRPDDSDMVFANLTVAARALLSDRERMTRRIAELEAAVDQLRSMRSPHILGGPGYETGDEAFWRRQQESRASLPSDPDHE